MRELAKIPPFTSALSRPSDNNSPTFVFLLESKLLKLTHSKIKKNMLSVVLVSLVATFYWYSLGLRGHDDEASSTSEDEGYPEDMDQDKHDDSTDDSDSDRSDADSEGDELMHHDDSADREGGEDKKSGKLVRKVEIHLCHFSPNLSPRC